ncbi:Uncharacterised protein [Mycobacterium tuberculosis]|nr:Uncharacterised protein [Mycobacterium tuberculosis]
MAGGWIPPHVRIEALIDEQDYLANYHLAWYAVTTRRGGSRGFAA